MISEISQKKPRQIGSLPELLAPAGSFDALIAAVAAGADAVYLSGTRFGARRYAANFTEEDLARAIEYAHLRGVSVYVTVNTLIRDAELADVAAYLVRLYEMGADAVLVQDAGVAKLARELAPDLALHASTQMTIHNREGVAYAAGHGFSRVVLAREMPLAEIEEIREAAEAYGIGLEVFIHGALCYCYSGQCLLSSVIGGRSGNRGMCAQPCRRQYDLVAGRKDEYGRPVDLRPVPLDETYLLSTRDLAVYPHLDRIVASGIASLKIEGRMRSPEYVATVVNIYRQALDAIAAGTWSPSPDDMQDLALAFSRGFTAGHILGDASIMGRDLPGNRGLLIGMVTGYDPGRREATVLRDGDFIPAPGDGLVFCRDRPGGDEGLVLRSPPAVRGNRILLPSPVPVGRGTRVFLTKRAGLEERARSIIARELPPLPLDMRVSWEERVPVFEGTVVAPDGREIRFCMRSDAAMEPARSRPLTGDQIAAQLTKTGGTVFTIRNLRLDYPGGLFAPIGDLNRLRRSFLDHAASALAAAYRPDDEAVRAAAERLRAFLPALTADPVPSDEPRHPAVAVYAATIDEVRGGAAGGAGAVFFEPQVRADSGVFLPLLAEAAAVCRSEGADLIWKWPPITPRGFLDVAVPLLPSLAAAGLGGVMVSGSGAAAAAAEAVPDLPLYGAAGLNIWNHRTVGGMSPLFRYLTLSPELSGADLAGLVVRVRQTGSGMLFGFIVQGNLEAMVTEDRLLRVAGAETGDAFYGIRDTKRRIFPIRIDGEGRTYLANAVETSLIDHLPALIGAGLDSFVIDARGRGGRYAREMAGLYRTAIESGGVAPRLKDAVKQRSCGGITAGHFLRGTSEE